MFRLFKFHLKCLWNKKQVCFICLFMSLYTQICRSKRAIASTCSIFLASKFAFDDFSWLHLARGQTLRLHRKWRTQWFQRHEHHGGEEGKEGWRELLPVGQAYVIVPTRLELLQFHYITFRNKWTLFVRRHRFKILFQRKRHVCIRWTLKRDALTISPFL